MHLADLVSADRSRILTEARSKKVALEQLSELLAGATPNLAAGEIFTALTGREKLGSTGLGDGVAIPHGRLKGLDDCVGAILRLPADGVDFEAPDGKPVDIMFGLLVPQDSTEAHLGILRSLAEMFTEDGTVRRLRQAKTEADLHALLIEHDASAQAF